jgi:phage FluMu protein Com
MTQAIACPHCQARLRLPVEAYGSSVKCPRCQNQFMATDAPQAAPAIAAAAPDWPGAPAAPPPVSRRAQDEPAADDWQNVAAAPKMSEEAHSLYSVQTGVAFYFLGHILYASGMGIMLLFFLVIIASSSGPPGRAAQIIMLLLVGLGFLAILSGWVLSLVGSCFWTPAPVGAGARGLGLACLVVGGLVLLNMGGAFPHLAELGRGGGGGQGGELSILLMAFLEAARLVLFPFFLRAMAQNVRSRALATQATALGITTGGVIAGIYLIHLLVSLVQGAAGPSPTVMKITAILYLLAWIGLLVWGMLVLLSARNLMSAKVRQMQQAA